MIKKGTIFDEKKGTIFDEENSLGFSSLKTTKPLQGEKLLITKSPEFMVLILVTSLGRKAELTLEPHDLHYLWK